MTAPGSEQRRGMREMADLLDPPELSPELLRVIAETKAMIAEAFVGKGPFRVRLRTHASEGNQDA